MIPHVAILAAALAAGGQVPAAPGASRAPIDEAKVARAFAGCMVQVEAVVAAEGAKEKLVISSPGVVIGARQVLVLSPRLKKVLSVPGASVRLNVDDGHGTVRKVPGRLIRTDAQTGLSVLEADELRAQVLSFTPPRVLQKKEPVVLVEPGKDGSLHLRRGELVQVRAYLDQGNGKNPLLLVKVLETRGGEERYGRWENDLVAGSGTLLADRNGGLLGLITPPALDTGGAPRTSDGGSSAPGLKEGEVIALPAEIARFVVESLSLGKAPVRGYFGASFREAPPPEDARHLAFARPAVRVEKVYPGGPAEQAGLLAGDWLMGISEKRPITYADVIRFSELVEYGGQGKTVRILVARGSAGHYKLLQLKIFLGER